MNMSQNIFFNSWWQGMKHRFIAVTQSQNKGQHSGWHKAKVLQKSRNPINRKKVNGELTARAKKTAIDRSFFIEIPHPPYSPALGPSQLYVFPKLKKYLRGNRYEDDSEIISAVQDRLDTQL